jgi:hypothetical protein
VALGLGWFTTELRRAKSQTEDVKAIVKSGGAVGYRCAFGGTDCDFQSPFRVQRRWLAWLVDDGFLADAVHVSYVPWDDLLDHGAWQTVDADLAPLDRLPHVESLCLHRASRLTDAGFKHLGRLTRLRELSLIGAKVTDTGLEQLNGLAQLEVLDIQATHVTPAGAKRLGDRLPGCTILTGGQSFP